MPQYEEQEKRHDKETRQHQKGGNKKVAHTQVHHATASSATVRMKKWHSTLPKWHYRNTECHFSHTTWHFLTDTLPHRP